MAKSRKRNNDEYRISQQDNPPAGATRKAFDREDLGGGPPGSPLGDRHAAGEPAGGSEVGGLGGSNIGDGSPVEPGTDLAAEEEAPFSGHSGGAVGGTPAGRRSSGGKIHGGIAPGGVHRGDSTIGSKPEGGSKTSPRRRSKKRNPGK